MSWNKTEFYSIIVFFILLILTGSIFADSSIHLNSLGYLPQMPKQSTITVKSSVFHVKDSLSEEMVYTGDVRGPLHQEDINQDVWLADFSVVKTAGEYYLDVEGVGKSIKFRIAEDVYTRAYYTSMRGFYLWRCGMDVTAEYQGDIFSHKACHLDDGSLDYIGEKGSKRDGIGGWHDAGDYGKYTVNAGVTMGVLFMAWDQFQLRLKEIALDIPDTAKGFPDFLKELKWETDWLLKMQYQDGSGRVSHKLTRRNFSGFVMPEYDRETRYFTDWSTVSTADFVAVMATAARVFKPYDAGYAKVCLDAATVSYGCLKRHPENKSADLIDFSTGGYGTRDADDRLWAAGAMWETTGKAEYLNDFENYAKKSRRKIEAVWDWGNVANLGMFTYILSERSGRNPVLLDSVCSALVETADSIVQESKDDVYGRPFGGRYYWGCNGTVARQTVILMTAHQIKPNDDYINASLDAVGHLFGRNYYGRSFVTGLGHNPPMNPHDRRSGADKVEAPWPGYLVGGGYTATNWQDKQEDYRTNEIAVNWQAALVYALAGAMSQ